MSHRVAHVYRIYETDDDGNVTNPDIWVDVMRIDRTVFSEPRGSPDGENYIGRAYVVKWGDNTPQMGDGADAPSRRRYEKLEVIEPPVKGGDPQDPSLASVAIPIITSTSFTYRGSEQGFGRQGAEWVFKNDYEPTGRRTTLLRVTNNDLNGQDTDWFPPPNQGDPQPPMTSDQEISWRDYFDAMQNGTIDDTQFVDTEITDRFWVRFPPSPFDQTGALAALQGQNIRYVMNWGQVENWFSAPPERPPGSVYRTDPFQCIVNVSWGGLAVEFYDHGD